MLKQACEQLKIPLDVPYENLSKADQQTVLYGSNGKTFHFHYQNDFGGVRDVDAVFEGVINNVDRRYHETNSDFTRDVMRKYMTELTCQTCHGFRLNRKALSVKVGGEHIGMVSDLAIGKEIDFFKGLKFSEQDLVFPKQILNEFRSRYAYELT